MSFEAIPAKNIDLNLLTVDEPKTDKWDRKNPDGTQQLGPDGKPIGGNYYTQNIKYNGGRLEFFFGPLPFFCVWPKSDPNTGRTSHSILFVYKKEHDEAKSAKTFFENLEKKLHQLIFPFATKMRITVHGGQFLSMKKLVGYAKDTDGNEKTETDPGTFFKIYPSCKVYGIDQEPIPLDKFYRAEGELLPVFHARRIYSNGTGPGSIQISLKHLILKSAPKIIGNDKPTGLIDSLNSDEQQLTNFKSGMADFMKSVESDESTSPHGNNVDTNPQMQSIGESSDSSAPPPANVDHRQAFEQLASGAANTTPTTQPPTTQQFAQPPTTQQFSQPPTTQQFSQPPTTQQFTQPPTTQPPTTQQLTQPPTTQQPSTTQPSTTQQFTPNTNTVPSTMPPLTAGPVRLNLPPSTQ